MRKCLLGLLAAAIAMPCTPAANKTPTEQEVKAVILYRFAHFVDWPENSLADGRSPFVIGVVGSDAFATLLDDVVRGENVKDHPIEVRRFRTAEAIGQAHILFVERSEGARLDQAIALSKGRGTLTVSDLDDAMQRGAMIQLATVDKKIRLRINVDSARAAGLTINSNLLRSADIVPGGTQN